MPAVITFSSDYGPTDHYVGVCHAVIARIAPDVRVIDLVHGLRDIRHGSIVLSQSLPFAPTGTHLAVVDPGVGTPRRGVVIAARDGSCLVGPDNGLLPAAADALGGVEAVFELTEAAYRLDPLSATFHGRDVFAPAAAHLSLGVPPDRFGARVDDPVRLPPARVEVFDARLVADVAFIDWYGNVVLAASAADLERAGVGSDVVVSTDAGTHDARVGRTFADVARGSLVVYVDSGGYVCVARNGGSASALLQDPDVVTVTAR